MEETIIKLEKYLNCIESYFINSNNTDITFKTSNNKWSKKEILGHLIDSGINNYQRFTEIQFESKPYLIREYNQDALVKANNYQNAELIELIGLWLSINQRIIKIMWMQTENTLNYKVEIDNKFYDLRFLMIDYVDHLKHHINQIMN